VAGGGIQRRPSPGVTVRQRRQIEERRDVASFQTSLWWAMVQRDFSSRWGALANARASVERDQVAAAQRAEAERALARIRERAGGRHTQVS
jgi:hypothetical protein